MKIVCYQTALYFQSSKHAPNNRAVLLCSISSFCVLQNMVLSNYKFLRIYDCFSKQTWIRNLGMLMLMNIFIFVSVVNRELQVFVYNVVIIVTISRLEQPSCFKKIIFLYMNRYFTIQINCLAVCLSLN